MQLFLYRPPHLSDAEQYLAKLAMLYRRAYNRFNEINLSHEYDNANAKQDVIELRIGFSSLVQNALLLL